MRRPDAPRSRTIVAILAVLVLLVAACGAPAAAPSPTATTTATTTKSAAPASASPAALKLPPLPPKPSVPSGPALKWKFVTDFGFNGRHAPYYVALDKGFFKDMGFDIEIVRGAGSLDAIKQVGAGNAQVGFADAASLVATRANENVPVKELLIVYNNPPQALYCLASSGIKVPKDLEGKKLSDSASSGVPKIFPAYAKAEGIDVNKVTWVYADSTALPSLLVSRQVDCVSQFTVGEALLIAAAGGQPLVRFAFADAPGMDFYSNGIIATDDMIKSQPDALKRFDYAIIEGLDYAFQHPDEAAQIMHKYHPEVTVDVAKAETLAVEDIALTTETAKNGLGYVDPSRMQKTIDIITPALDLKRKVSVDEVYTPGFVPR